jgi:CRP-like cAMP-binding protein
MSSPTPENRLLAALPPNDFDRLIARMTDVTLGHKDLLYAAGDPIEHVYFPRSGVVSAVVVMIDGQSAETAAIGREGMLGVSTFLGAVLSSEQVFCQVYPAVCRKMVAAEFVAEVAQGGALRDIVYRYTQGTLIASSRQTACNALHSIDERCARWLLMCHDRAGTDEFPLTHEFLSTMLGVRRATVTVTAGSLQSAGLITYRHGKVKVIDRPGLEDAACECYAAIREAFEIPAN